MSDFDLAPRIVRFHDVYTHHGHDGSEALLCWILLRDDLAEVISRPAAHRAMRAVHAAYRAEQEAVLAGYSMEEVLDLVKARQAAWAVVSELVDEQRTPGHAPDTKER